MIPYGRQHIDEDDILAVERILRGDFLTTGPAIAAFEKDVAQYCSAAEAVAVANGTAALHVAMLALGIKPGDEVIVPPLTFAATANCVRYVGATPVFADVDEKTLAIDPVDVGRKITPSTKAVIGVDYAGNTCDWDALKATVAGKDIILVADSCHALGATYKGVKTGTVADLTVFSFHPVKHITTGEGGMILTDDADTASRCRLFRTHGITSDSHQRDKANAWYYEMTDLGFNYRMTDIQAALGSSQLKKLDGFLARRREIAKQYDDLFAECERVTPLGKTAGCEHAYHLYVVKVPERNKVFSHLRQSGIGVNVHYIPVHLHPYYRRELGLGPGLCPVAEAAYEQIISLPMFPDLADAELLTVADTLTGFVNDLP
jgi:perosamine synthetase